LEESGIKDAENWGRHNPYRSGGRRLQ